MGDATGQMSLAARGNLPECSHRVLPCQAFFISPFSIPRMMPRAKSHFPAEQPVLHEPSAHEALHDVPWDEGRVRAVVREVVAGMERMWDSTGLWPLHPLDVEGKDDDWAGVTHGIYLGAAGMLWALDRLTQAGAAETLIDLAAAAVRLHEGYLQRCHAPDEPMPSLWVGEAGVLLVAELLAPDPARRDRLLDIVRGNACNETRDLLWGAAGTMLAAREMHRRTGEERWAVAWRESAEVLLAQWCLDDELGCHLWTQIIEGRSNQQLGAAHGFAGNVFSLLSGIDLLRVAQREEIIERATRTVVATAVVAGSRANWPVVAGGALSGSQSARTQWCHGAPGIVCSLAALPANPALDPILVAGGELTWDAGPLVKGAGLCHGTAGNGFAFLALFARTGDEVWLERARGFAMHALAQLERQREQSGGGHSGLWTGDLGAVLYAWQCITGDPAMPALTAW